MVFHVFPQVEAKVADDFNPNITQRVIAKAKEETAEIRFAFWKSHRQDFLMFYGYFIGSVEILKQNWPELMDYVPAGWQRAIIGTITVLVLADKLLRNRPGADPQ